MAVREALLLLLAQALLLPPWASCVALSCAVALMGEEGDAVEGPLGPRERLPVALPVSCTLKLRLGLLVAPSSTLAEGKAAVREAGAEVLGWAAVGDREAPSVAAKEALLQGLLAALPVGRKLVGGVEVAKALGDGVPGAPAVGEWACVALAAEGVSVAAPLAKGGLEALGVGLPFSLLGEGVLVGVELALGALAVLGLSRVVAESASEAEAPPVLLAAAEALPPSAADAVTELVGEGSSVA